MNGSAPTLIAKSTTYMARTATTIVSDLCYTRPISIVNDMFTMERLTVASSLIKRPTSSAVQPSVRRQATTTTEPPIMKGLRLPHFDLDRSAITPTIGWTIRPESGPAIHTRDVRLLLRPSWRRYGVQSSGRFQQTKRFRVGIYVSHRSSRCPK